MGLDTKTYWLTDCQSQCDFDFNFESQPTLRRNMSPPSLGLKNKPRNKPDGRWTAELCHRICSFETSVDFQRSLRRYIPEEKTLLRPYIRIIIFYLLHVRNIFIKYNTIWKTKLSKYVSMQGRIRVPWCSDTISMRTTATYTFGTCPIQTDVAFMFFQSGVDGAASLPNVDFATLTGDLVWNIRTSRP
jgi:hypothetical protein